MQKNIQNNIQSIQEEAVNYLMASKYNYLSSKMVESLIFNHPSVTPTINKIKDVDFFINIDSVAKTVQPVTDDILKNL